MCDSVLRDAPDGRTPALVCDPKAAIHNPYRPMNRAISIAAGARGGLSSTSA
jgi:hypothetical protein